MKKARAREALTILKRAGRRMTRVRRATVAALSSGRPLSAAELLRRLARALPTVHKTTVYRELSALSGEGVVQEVRFGDGAARYELKGGHHHHVVCERCGDVADVEIPESFESPARVSAGRSGFSVTRHALEFFGLCRECRA